MTSWWKRFRDLMGRDRTVSQLRIVARHDGMVIEDRQLDGSDEAIILPWGDISRVIAFKRDVYAGDLICLGIALANARVIEIDETTQGWREFLAALPTYLAGAMGEEEIFVRLTAKPDVNTAVVVFAQKETQTAKICDAEQ